MSDLNRALDLGKLREMYERPLQPPPGYELAVNRLKAMGYRFNGEVWYCGGARVVDDTVRGLLITWGSEAQDEIFDLLPEPSAIDRLAQITEETT